MSNATELAAVFKERKEICAAWEKYYEAKDKFYQAKQTYEYWYNKFCEELTEANFFCIDSSISSTEKTYERYIVSMHAFYDIAHTLNELLGSGPRESNDDLPF